MAEKRQVTRGFWLEDGDVVIASVGVISYLTPTGKQMYAVSADGDSPVSTYVGLLAMASHSMIADAEILFSDDEGGNEDG